VLSLNSLGARRGLVVNFSDLQELLNGCSQLEVGYNIRMFRFHSLITSVPTDWHSHLVSLLHESRKACWSTPSVYNCPINELKSTDIESLWYTYHDLYLAFISSFLRPCLLAPKYPKISKIPRHIESLDVCMEY